MENMDKIIVLVITITAAFLTWKMVFNFYKQRFHKIFAHIIAIMTASFMFISSMILFAPKNYQRGVTPEVEISFMAVVSVIAMVGVLYAFFKYIPSMKK
ncbi:MAG: hypothetical protein ACNI3C_07470 [Candidatus Marinarcus sp.]|uniref:hypothetical protein n=1 Tax=Candidatus Marinarcus sp. TaxID=3100987 RepID=UPI003AFFB572